MKAGWNDLQEALREEKWKKCLVTALGLLGHCKMPKTTQELRIWSNLLFGAVMTTEPVCFIKPSDLNSTANPYPRPWLCWALLSPKKKNGKGGGGQSLEKGWGAAPGRDAKEGLAHIGPEELQWILWPHTDFLYWLLVYMKFSWIHCACWHCLAKMAVLAMEFALCAIKVCIISFSLKMR